MALEDFEKELAEQQAARHSHKRARDASPERDQRRKHRHHHHRRHHAHATQASDGEPRLKHRSRHDREDRSHHHGRPRHHAPSRSRSPARSPKTSPKRRHAAIGDLASDGKTHDLRTAAETNRGSDSAETATRDSWMEPPSALDVEYMPQRRKQADAGSSYFVSGTANETHEDRRHRQELDHHLHDVPADQASEDVLDVPAQHQVDYTFGDAGSGWRMTKLQGVYREAKENGRPVEDVAMERFGDLRSFDDAREEETELERRSMYGNDYVGKEKPSGELYQDRKLASGIHRHEPVSRPEGPEESEDEFEQAQGQVMREKPPPAQTMALDQTALNKLKAQAMKANLAKAPNAAQLEAEYKAALAGSANSRQADVVVLNKMESRMLAGGRGGEVSSIDNKRGRERGLVEENEDMSIDDMVRQERRTRGQFGGEGRALAERISKDAKFDNDLDYMDENANKLAKHVQKSDTSLRNAAVGDYQKMKRILDTCPLCHHEDSGTTPQAPLVSLATRVYLTLPTSPEITPYGLCATIVPIQHRLNLLECDDDEWEEIRNFMKSLTRFYYAQKPRRSVIFYENAAHEGRKRHASLEAVPLSLDLGETAPQFFKEAILAADEEWTQHRKVIDTLAKATDGGLGKHAFRKSMVSELPYFHVWFRIDGGLGHVVEDARRWPKGDLFAREIIGGMLDVGPEVIKRQGRWQKGDPDMGRRVKDFRKGWEKFDWTTALLEPQ